MQPPKIDPPLDMDSANLLVNMNEAQKKWKSRAERMRLLERADPRVKLKLFVNESTWTERLRFYFIKNRKTSLRIRLFNFTLKICSVILYVVRASLEDPETTTCCEMCVRNWTTEVNPWWSGQYEFSWKPIIWVHRPFPIWIVQVIIACICFVQAIVTIFVNYKGNLAQNVLTMNNFLEFLCTVPFIVTLCWEPLRCMFVPVYLNVWIAKSRLNNMINDLQRATQKQKSAMFNQMCVLFATIISLLLTCICSVQQLERAGRNRLDMFDATWFVVVTFSTVGYGNIIPTVWPSRVIVIVTICVALGVLPSQVEDLAHLWSQSQKQGGEYSRQRATTEKHVIVCATELRLDVIMEFLNEFYAHPFFQNHFVVLLSPSELEGSLRKFLQIPIWMERVIYLQGSALRESDLLRAKLDAAEACFILTSRHEGDRDAADEKTILRAMACKDHAPHCPLYVQILKPSSKFHVQFADQVICDDEFKYALLAMNCYIPGLSTMVTLLAHTSKGREGDSHKTVWKRHFGQSAGNEIYHVEACESKFFGEFIGYRFAHAAQLAHAKCGATLIGLKHDEEIRINPGLSCVIEGRDVLFYICVTHEEDAVIVTQQGEHLGMLAKSHAAGAEKVLYEEATRKTSIPDAENGSGDHVTMETPFKDGASISSRRVSVSSMYDESPIPENAGVKTVVGFPPIFPYVGHVTPTLCHILAERKKYCCLRHDRICEHRNASESHDNGPIVVCAEYSNQSLVNVMIPLRAHYRPLESLHPVILVLEHSPEDEFLETISCFPMVYYMLGNMDSLDSLLLAGIIRAHTVIIIDRMTSIYAGEEYMADSRQLVAAQTIFKLFPTIPTCLELTHTSNMRFNHFSPPSRQEYIDELRKERNLEKTCSLPYLFQESFASGQVFSSSMLDTLLYQSVVKSYLMTLLRLMLGLQYGPGSGYLTTHVVATSEEGRKYSSVFKELSFRKGGILLGIYRKEKVDDGSQDSAQHSLIDVTKMHKDMMLYSALHTDDAENTITAPRKQRHGSLSMFNVKKSIKSRLYSRSMRKSNKISVRRLQLLQHSMTERENLDHMIQARAARLGLSPEHSSKLQNSKSNCLRSFGYVMLNPPSETILKKGDILYVILPEVRSHPSEDIIDPPPPATSRIRVIDEVNHEDSDDSFFEDMEGPSEGNKMTSAVVTGAETPPQTSAPARSKDTLAPNGSVNGTVPETTIIPVSPTSGSLVDAATHAM